MFAFAWTKSAESPKCFMAVTHAGAGKPDALYSWVQTCHHLKDFYLLCFTSRFCLKWKGRSILDQFKLGKKRRGTGTGILISFESGGKVILGGIVGASNIGGGGGQYFSRGFAVGSPGPLPVTPPCLTTQWPPGPAPRCSSVSGGPVQIVEVSTLVGIVVQTEGRSRRGDAE